MIRFWYTLFGLLKISQKYKKFTDFKVVYSIIKHLLILYFNNVNVKNIVNFNKNKL